MDAYWQGYRAAKRVAKVLADWADIWQQRYCEERDRRTVAEERIAELEDGIREILWESDFCDDSCHCGGFERKHTCREGTDGNA